ncbi:MAG: hypothetical protein WCJ09_27835 [Planctomycetota bacterium]
MNSEVRHHSNVDASALILAGKLSSIWSNVPIYACSSHLAMWPIFGNLRSGRL